MFCCKRIQQVQSSPELVSVKLDEELLRLRKSKRRVTVILIVAVAITVVVIVLVIVEYVRKIAIMSEIVRWPG